VTNPRTFAQAQDHRDDALARVRRTFRFAVAGSVASVAVIVGVVAHQIPGRSSSAATTANTAPPPASAGGSSGASGSTGATGATGNTGSSAGAPAPAPAPTRQAPTVVSGGTGW
jgi:hypothetical protein